MKQAESLKLSSTVGAKGQSVGNQIRSDVNAAGGAAGKLMMKACQDASNST